MKIANDYNIFYYKKLLFLLIYDEFIIKLVYKIPYNIIKTISY